MFPECEELSIDDSALNKFLSSDLFGNDDDSGEVDLDAIKVFGLLHCQGSPEKKAKHYLEMARQQLKLEESIPFNTERSQNCTLFAKFFRIASHGLFKTLADIGEADPFYSDSER